MSRRYEGKASEVKALGTMAEAWQAEGFFWSAASVIETVQNGHVIILYEEDASKATWKSAAVISDLTDHAEILFIYVDPEYRRNRAGEKLMHEILAYGKNRWQMIFLEVRVSNEPAKNFYLQQGFVSKGVRKRYYNDGEDALIMEKAL
jgi:ribosomal protein S18 acetylase RimI-like enzyme